MFAWLRKRNEVTIAVSPAPTAVTSQASVPAGELPVLDADQLLARTGGRALVEVMRVKTGFPCALFDSGVLPLVNAYAEFCQLLPVLTPRGGVQPGGLLLHGLEAASAALDFRRGQILPRGAAPETIGAQHYRWTYAVLVAALLHDIERPVSALQVLARVPDREPFLWRPMTGALRAHAAASYHWEQRGDSTADDMVNGKLELFLLDRLVPLVMIEWLSADANLIRELLSHLGHESAAERGPLTELAARARAYAAGIALTPMRPTQDRHVVAAPRTPPSAKDSPPDDPLESEAEFLDPVDDPEPAPKKRKVR